MKLIVKRCELKYHINAQETLILKSRLAEFMNPDLHNMDNGYKIRSLYFDNCLSTSYYDKVEGFEKRTKYRLRLYDFSSKTLKLELKHKLNDVIYKETSTISRHDMENLQNGNYDCLLHDNDETLRKIYYHFKRHYFEPVVIVDYFRTAYFLDFNRIRITFDSHLEKSNEVTEFSNPELMMIPVLEKNHIILEIKYNDFLPEWIYTLFRGARLVRSSASKYCLSRMI